jgi:anthranilate/para-aminobenzoate synthase component I
MSTKKPSKSKPPATKPSKGASSPFHVAAVWPHHESPLLLSMVGGEQIFVATSFTPVDFAKLADTSMDRWTTGNEAGLGTPDLPRWLAILPYETFNDISSQTNNPDRALAWEIHAGIMWKIGGEDPKYHAKSSAKTARFHLDEQRVKEILKSAREFDLAEPQPLRLTPTTSDETYLDTVQNLIRAISAGDFYQVNLLRYFHASSPSNWQNLCALMHANAGPHGVLMAMGNRIVSSFSPERFIEIKQTGDCAEISTWPIKGTMPRNCLDPDSDTKQGEKLATSTKDLAELHMIIDLMRNDFAKICESESVKVIETSALRKFTQVWHLEGHVTGRLKTSQTLKSILSAVCPGGSITGAPKIAAMRRINLEEGRQRGYFMGNFLRINHDGSLQSNILIRTLVSDNGLRSATYAAGSGLVVKSDPRSELLEINAKCTPITLQQTKLTNPKSLDDIEDET